MGPPTLDPTAGERARNIHQHPEVSQGMADPTDRRCGQLTPGGSERAGSLRLIVDPTDPACGRLRN